MLDFWAVIEHERYGDTKPQEREVDRQPEEAEDTTARETDGARPTAANVETGAAASAPRESDAAGWQPPARLPSLKPPESEAS